MNENIYEIIKAFAYGSNAEKVAEVMEISPEEAERYQKDYAAEIRETREDLRKAGYIE